MTAELWGKSKPISNAAFTCGGKSSPQAGERRPLLRYQEGKDEQRL